MPCRSAGHHVIVRGYNPEGARGNSGTVPARRRSGAPVASRPTPPAPRRGAGRAGAGLRRHVPAVSWASYVCTAICWSWCRATVPVVSGDWDAPTTSSSRRRGRPRAGRPAAPASTRPTSPSGCRAPKARAPAGRPAVRPCPWRRGPRRRWRPRRSGPRPGDRTAIYFYGVRAGVNRVRTSRVSTRSSAGAPVARRRSCCPKTRATATPARRSGSGTPSWVRIRVASRS